MRLGPRVWGAGKLLLLAGSLVATFFVFAAIAMRVAVRALEVRVPELAGKPVEEARTLASDLGLVVRVDESRRPDPKVPAGHVLGQDPPAGSNARRQRGIAPLGERGTARRGGAETDRRIRARGADSIDPGRRRDRRARRDSRSRLPA